jgi:uncharacterized Fe-S radical SAM superfamily protein PflX
VCTIVRVQQFDLAQWRADGRDVDLELLKEFCNRATPASVNNMTFFTPSPASMNRRL